MKKEKWEEIYSKEQLKKIQEIELESLKVFINTCKKIGVDYFVYGGTLLGAIKYNGFIPWDDDVDVGLSREDYNTFLREAPKFLPKNYVLQNPHIDNKTPYLYTKMRKKGTRYIEEFYDKLDIEQGVYIDIYPIDNIPDNEKLRKKQYKKVKRIIWLNYFRQCLRIKYPFSIKKIHKIIAQIILYYFLRIIPYRLFLDKLDKEMTRYNSIKTSRKACLFSPNYDNIYIKLYPLLNAKFEDLDVSIPNCYDDHLKKRYGNYKEDLAKDKRIGHKPFIIEI